MAWLQRLRPDSLVTSGWIYENLVLAGWRKPSGTKVVWLDWSPNRWGFGGIYQGEGNIGANAVDIVAGQLQRNERGVPENVKVLLSVGKWIEEGGVTTRRRTQSVT